MTKLSSVILALEGKDIRFILRDDKTLKGIVKEVGEDYVAIALEKEEDLAYIPLHSIINFFGPEYIPNYRTTVL